MTDLEAFIAWAKQCGHYHITDAYENYLKFLESQKQIGNDDE